MNPGEDRPFADPGDELVEIVAVDGTVDRVVTRREMRRDRLRHRATFVAVVDAAGRVLLHQRSPLKDIWPLRWDLAAGGVAAIGEPWAAAAARELREELGIVAPLERLGAGVYDDDDVALVAELFRTSLDPHQAEAIRFADGEVVDAVWETLDNVAHRIAVDRDSFCPDSVALVWPHLRDGVI